MLKSLKFYKNEKEETYRIVGQINSDTFVVVKCVTSKVRTAKIWKGSNLSKTASYWSTKEFVPDRELATSLTSYFYKSLSMLTPAFETCIKWGKYAN